MEYMVSQNSILVANSNKIIIANPYSLVSQTNVALNQIISFFQVQSANYIIVTLAYNQLVILDSSNLKTIKILDNSSDLKQQGVLQIYTKLFAFSTQNLLICSDQVGLYIWTVDFNKLNFTYNGYIDDTKNSSIQKFEKHPSYDILILGGQDLIKFIQIDQNLQFSALYTKQSVLNGNKVESIIFQNIDSKDCIIIGDTISLYIFSFKIGGTGSLEVLNFNQEVKQDQENYYDGNKITEIPVIVYASKNMVTFFDYQQKILSYKLNYPSDFFNKNFIFSVNQQEYLLFIQQNKLVLNQKNSNTIGNFFQEQPILSNILEQFNSFYKVKNSDKCFFIKTIKDGKNFIVFKDFTSIQSPYLQFSIDDAPISLKWSDINQNLDPFLVGASLYIVFSQPNQILNPGETYYFQLLKFDQNLNLSDNIKLDTRQNQNKASLTIFDPVSNIIYGIDQNGKVYEFHEFQSIFTDSYQINDCLNPQIGDIFVNGQNKFLIIGCSNSQKQNNIISYNLSNKSQTTVASLEQAPIVLQIFSDKQIFAIGDSVRGSAKIFKLNNQQIPSFDFFIEIFSSKGVDTLLQVDLLKDSTLLLQFKNCNIFFQFSTCLDDINNCLSCEQNYYFKIQSGLDSNQTYGQGTKDQQFITPQNFLISMLKAQIYKNLVRQLTSLEVNILVDKTKAFVFNSSMLTFDFSNIISLSMMCSNCQQGEFFSLQYSDLLLFQNYVQVNMNQVSLFFTDLNQGETCGLVMQNIQKSSKISYLQIITLSQYGQNCNQIIINNSTVVISNFNVQNQNFSSHKSIVTVSDSAEVTLENFTLYKCTLGRSFSILTQKNDVKVNLNTVTIINNLCPTTVPDDTIVSSLFSASLFNVTNFNLNDNSICNTLIFTTAASIQQVNQKFSFSGIKLLRNTFIAKTSYIFFNALYQMVSKPTHEVVFTDLYFSNNKLNVSNSSTDQQISSLIYTSKIATVTFINVSIVNQTYIYLTIIDNSNKVQLTNVNCTNEPSYNKDIPITKRTAGCLYFTEVSDLNINTINISNRLAVDENLIRFESYFTQNVKININKASFQGNNLYQKAGNAPTNPFYVMIMYKAQIYVRNSNFTSNTYTINEKSHDKFIVSTSGIGARYQEGTLDIQGCLFQNSTSNSGYNFVYVLGDDITMEKTNFLSSSYTEEVGSQPYIFKNYGGNLYLQVNSITFSSCTFSKSTGIQGAFLYIQPNTGILSALIEHSVFNEGYASNSGAIYFYPSFTVQFNCENCTFTNVYTTNVGTSAAIIGLENSVSLEISRHSIIFDGGSIKNVYGNGDNNFFYLVKTDLELNNFQTITTEDFNSLFAAFVKKANTVNKGLQPAQLANVEDSDVQITNCNLSNWSQLKSSSIPLLIQSLNSKVTISNSSFKSSTFKNQVIKVTGGQLILDKVTFSGFQQISNSRILQTLIVKQPSLLGSSLIQVISGKLQLKNVSTFSDITCAQGCNGGSLQLLNSNFNITKTTFTNSNSDFGGAIYISGLNGQNSITNSLFQSNNANYDGGALYLSAADADIFNLTLGSSQFIENKSINSKGGAMYIYSSSLNSNNQKITIQTSQIQGNQAQVGGAISNQNIAPKDQDNQFNDNKGIIYGNNQFSYPTELVYYDIDAFLKQNKNSSYNDGLLTIQNFRSGDKIPTIALQFKNQENIIYPLSESEVSQYSISIQVYQATSNVSYDLVGDLTSAYDEDTKSFVFTNIQAVGTPESSQYFEFKSNNIKILNPLTQKYESNYSLKIQIQFRSCQAGEEIQKYKQLIECSPCPQNTYSLDLNGCQQCPDGAKCLGGTDIIVESGYWRSSFSSSEIIKCDNSLSNCLGGTYGNVICFEGHIGALCEQCDIEGIYWHDKFAKSGDFSCTNCSKITGNLYIVILMTIWTMISMTIAIRGDIDSLENAAAALTIKRNIQKRGSNILDRRPTHVSMANKKSFGNNEEDEQRAGTYVKMLTNYLQIINTLASFNLSLPSGIYSAPEAVGRPLQQSMNSLDCALSEVKTNIPIIYLRVMFSLLIPILYLLLFFIGIALSQLFNKGRSFPWYILSTGIMFLIIYVQPDLVSQVISLLSCRKIGSQYYILGDVSYICHNEQHDQYSYFFLIPVLIFWIFLIPLILCLLLWRKSDKLETLDVKLRYGFLYKEYTRWYWEFVKMGEKIAIILVLNFFYSNVPVKGLISFQIIVIYGILAQKFNPYKEEFINKLDVYSTNCSAASILIGVFIYDNSYNYLVIIGFIMLILLNAWYIINLFIKILSGYIYKMKNITKMVIEILASKIDYFKKYLPKEEKVRKMNPQVRDKIRRILNKFISLPPAEKKAMILKIYEDQLTEMTNQEYKRIKQKVNSILLKESQNLNQKEFSDTTVQRRIDKTETLQQNMNGDHHHNQISPEKDNQENNPNLELIVFETSSNQISENKKTEISSLFQKKISMNLMAESNDKTPQAIHESPYNGFENQQNPEINALIKIDGQKFQNSGLNLMQNQQ